MELTAEFVFLLIAAYFLGAIPFGVVLSRIVARKDVRSHGSGNIGATNVSRLMGKKWGILVLFLDAFKGFLIVKLAQRLGLVENQVNLIALVAVVGHCFPIYLKFKGGKGVATALGVLTALSPMATLVCFGVFLAVFLLSRIISVSSLASGLAIVGIAGFTSWGIQLWMAVLLTSLIWWKHKENIIRLINRQEPRFF